MDNSGTPEGLASDRPRIWLAFDQLDDRVLVVDLSEVTLLGSPGLRVLQESAEQALHHRGLVPLRIVVDETRPVIRPI